MNDYKSPLRQAEAHYLQVTGAPFDKSVYACPFDAGYALGQWMLENKNLSAAAGGRRILHLSARREQLEVSLHLFMRLNHPGIATSKGQQPRVTMTNGDEHVWMTFDHGEHLRGTEWDCVIVDEDIRRFMVERDYAHMLDIVPTRVRPK